MLKLTCREEHLPAWKKPADMAEVIWRLLALRGVENAEQACAFLCPSENDLIDPMRLHDMDKVVRRIVQAQAQNETVCIWGDYDVDGISATAILFRTLQGMGMNVFEYIPSRQDEGYGLNEKGLRSIAQSAQLLITVDCGISAAQLIDCAQAELGLSVIVTDHHRPGEKIPDCLIVNPLLNDYPNHNLCGAGVAFQLSRALIGEGAFDYIDLAALATIADVVELVGENRVIVALGLKRMNEAPRPGIAALIKVSALKGELRAGNVAFQLAPRLNAAGRMDSAMDAFLLLIADKEKAEALADRLNGENANRRQVELAILKQTEAMLSDFDFANDRVIVVSGADWNPGVVGLVASRLVEKYNMPAIVLSNRGGMLTGSCRSIPGVDIFDALNAVGYLLTKYGGHKQAAGLTLPEAQLAQFMHRINDYVKQTADEDAFIPSAAYDLPVSLKDIDWNLLETLEKMQPTGFGNPAPVLCADVLIESANAVGKEGAPHVSLAASGDGCNFKGIWFGHGSSAQSIRGTKRSLLFCPRTNEFNGHTSIQLEVKGISEVDPSGAFTIEISQRERLLHAFLTKMCYNTAHFPIQSGAWIDLEALFTMLTESTRSTLIVAADVQLAQMLMRDIQSRAPSCAFDVFAGQWPTDKRAFNAVCLLPVGDMPKGYERIIALGMPGSAFCDVGAEKVFQLSGRAQWLDALPDVKSLRAVYLAVKKLLARPYAFGSVLALSRDLSDISGADALCMHAGLYVLNELGLVEFSVAPLMLKLRPMVKVDPKSSLWFQTFEKLRLWGGAL